MDVSIARFPNLGFIFWTHVSYIKVGALGKKWNTKIWDGNICAGIDEAENLEPPNPLELTLKEEATLSHCPRKPVFPGRETFQ